MEASYEMLCFFPSWFYIYGTKQLNEAKFWVASCDILLDV